MVFSLITTVCSRDFEFLEDRGFSKLLPKLFFDESERPFSPLVISFNEDNFLFTTYKLRLMPIYTNLRKPFRSDESGACGYLIKEIR